MSHGACYAINNDIAVTSGCLKTYRPTLGLYVLQPTSNSHAPGAVIRGWITEHKIPARARVDQGEIATAARAVVGAVTRIEMHATEVGVRSYGDIGTVRAKIAVDIA